MLSAIEFGTKVHLQGIEVKAASLKYRAMQSISISNHEALSYRLLDNNADICLRFRWSLRNADREIDFDVNFHFLYLGKMLNSFLFRYTETKLNQPCHYDNSRRRDNVSNFQSLSYQWRNKIPDGSSFLSLAKLGCFHGKSSLNYSSSHQENLCQLEIVAFHLQVFDDVMLW